MGAIKVGMLLLLFSKSQLNGCGFWKLHPQLFDLAQEYEDKSKEIKGGHFQWNDEMPLREMRKPENIEKIKVSYEEHKKTSLGRTPK